MSASDKVVLREVSCALTCIDPDGAPILHLSIERGEDCPITNTLIVETEDGWLAYVPSMERTNILDKFLRSKA